jgi:hypothetical protein
MTTTQQDYYIQKKRLESETVIEGREGRALRNRRM